MHVLCRSEVCLSQAQRLTNSPAASDFAGAADVRFSTATVFLPSSNLGGSGAFCRRGSRAWAWTPGWNLSRTSCRILRGKVVCMATEKRVKMVSQQIKREISEMLIYDKVLHATLLPETTLGADMYLTSVATISDVEMSKDLSVAKVYISIYGDDRGQEKALDALKSKAGYVRKGLARRMNLKFTPEVRFIKDEALERGARVIGILDELKRQREAKAKKERQEEDLQLDENDLQDYDESQVTKDVEEESNMRRDDGDDPEGHDDLNIIYIK